MSQSSRDLVSSKSLDYALVIAGWPTIYTVAQEYAPAATGPLVGFDAVRQWADLPVAIGSAAKGRPEEGSTTIPQVEIAIVDRMENGRRALSDLLSRDSYLYGPDAANVASASIAIDLTPGSLEIHTAGGSYTGSFPDSGLLYVGLECIKYSGTSGGFQNCQRGHLLTSPTPHLTIMGARLYSFLPSLFQRKAFLYAGYQGQPLDDWRCAFGGVIVGAAKDGAVVRLSISSTAWSMYNDGRQAAFGQWPGPASSTTTFYFGDGGMLSIDASDIPVNVPAGAGMSANCLLKANGEWMAVTGVS
jgi:hypothetical protein